MASKSSSKSFQKGEVDLNWVMKYLKDGIYPSGLNFSEKRMVRKRAERFCYLNGDLYYLGTPTDQELGKKSRKVLLTYDERWKKVEEVHVGLDGNHIGLEKTADAIVSEYHWVGIYKFIKEFIRQCAVCREKHPHMLSVTQSLSLTPDTGVVVDCNFDEDAAEHVRSPGRTLQFGEGTLTDSGKGLFWEKVDMRLFGPYKADVSYKYILGFVDCHTKWPEAIVLDSITSTTVVQCILQMISRFGLMAGLLMSKDDEILEDALVRGLEILDAESDLQIPFLIEERDLLTDAMYKELAVIIEKFVKKYPSCWHRCFEFCLLPFRFSRQKKSPHTPSFLAYYREPVLPDSITNKKGGDSDIYLSSSEKIKSIETLMALHLTVSGEQVPFTSDTQKVDGTFSQPQPSGMVSSDTEKGQAVYVTRSRTGNTKPKLIDEDEFKISTPKRKSSPNMVDTLTRKRVKVESITASPAPVTLKDIASDTESEDLNTETKDKKAVDLDTYYQAITMYVQGNGYPENSSGSFKRLIRDQAKNYTIKDGLLYHEVGNKGTWKKIIATKEERVKILADVHQKTSNKTQMFAELQNIHWKGKLIDCEAFVLASPYCDRYVQKSLKDPSLRNLTEAKKLLKYDTMDTYNEIKNYLIYEVFSNDEMAARLDDIRRQIKSFRVEHDELIYVIGNKKRKVLLSGGERQRAIQEAYSKKGTNSDLNSTFNQLSETAFWFGMKLDVKIFINYCSTTTQDNKHLIDRYFAFREYHMKNYVPKESTAEEETGSEVVEECGTQATEDGDNQDDKPIPVKVPSVFVASAPKTEKELEKAMPNLAATLAAVETSLAAATVSSVVSTSSSGESQLKESLIIGPEVPLSEKTDSFSVPEEPHDSEDYLKSVSNQCPPGPIIVKLAEDGQTVLVTKSTVNKSNDDTTLEAVKSILPRSDSNTFSNMTDSQQTLEENTVGSSEIEIKPETMETSQTEGVIYDEGDMEIIQLDEAEEGENSDEIPFDTDEEDEDGFFEEDIATADVEGLSASGDGSDQTAAGGEKKPVTPRQHFKCSQCNKIFFGPIKFKMHMYKHTGHKPFPCNQCNKKYTNKKSLVIHQRTHTGDLPYQCTLCGKRMASKIALKSHLKCHDGKGGGFPARCDVCGRDFSRRHLMERHKLHKHTNAPQEFKCGECNKLFGHQRSLKRHFMSAHMGVKNHTCNLCGKSFYRKEYLTGHLLQHGGAAAEGISKRPRASTFKPRPSVFAQSYQDKSEKGEETVVDTEQVQRIILHQDEHGQLRVVDLETEREVKRMLDSQITGGEVPETMVVHIEDPSSGRPQVVHVEQTGDQIVEVPIEGQSEVEYQLVQERPQEFVISGDAAPTASTQYIYATSGGEIIQGNQDLVYGQPAVQYEVECVGDVGDEEALSAINLLAQASAQQYETVISQI